MQLKWQIRSGAHFQRILISATARTLSQHRLRDSARGSHHRYNTQFRIISMITWTEQGELTSAPSSTRIYRSSASLLGSTSGLWVAWGLDLGLLSAKGRQQPVGMPAQPGACPGGMPRSLHSQISLTGTGLLAARGTWLNQYHQRRLALASPPDAPGLPEVPCLVFRSAWLLNQRCLVFLAARGTWLFLAARGTWLCVQQETE